jgi:hypothetical protein
MTITPRPRGMTFISARGAHSKRPFADTLAIHSPAAGIGFNTRS